MKQNTPGLWVWCISSWSFSGVFRTMWRSLSALGSIATLLLLLAVASVPVRAADNNNVQDYIGKIQPDSFFPGADRFGPPEGTPALIPVLKGQDKLGYVYLNSDFVNSIGYSGKPIHLLVGLDLNGVIKGLKLAGHSEPIVLIGIPEQKIIDAMNVLIGKDVMPIAQRKERLPQVDIVSGATLTVLVMGDSVIRSAVKIIRSGRLGTDIAGAGTALPSRTVAMDKSETRSWQELLGDGSLRYLHLTVDDVNKAFTKAGQEVAAGRPETDDLSDTFIDLYVAPVSIPTIGRSLLGDAGYEHLKQRLGPDQQALIIAGSGLYSFKGSAYVRGGIFDRIELLQDGISTRFRDLNHNRLGDLAPDDAPQLSEIGLFVTPKDYKLDLGQPFQLQLLVQRSTGVRDKAFITFDLDYTTPERYLNALPVVAPAAQATAVATSVEEGADALDTPLWEHIWRTNILNISILIAALLVLTLIFFFQNFLVKNERVYLFVRRSYLLFILVWLGWWCNSQLSVVNVFAFFNSLISGFKWDYFLGAPLIFILWCAVAAGLLFWGRGPFCGWLCPFGALQEWLSIIAKWCRVPQITVPWWLHERLWPVKYIIFMALFGLSLYSIAEAEHYAEIEPFKTSIILKFVRDWPFVIYTLTLLSTGLFIERFFCRYLCPLGAALAIPGRLRIFEWLRRWPECGSPCQRCAKECPVQSIHPEGHINVNECIYCMHCQLLYHCEKRCPHMITVKARRDKLKPSTPLATSPKGSVAEPQVTGLRGAGPVNP